MAVVTVQFESCLQDSQELGSNDEHMVSRVFFSLLADGKRYDGLSADIKQTVGAKYESDPLEVGRPEGYEGPFNWDGFRKCVESYYRSLVGSGATGIRIEGASNVRMRNNKFGKRATCQFDAERASPSGS